MPDEDAGRASVDYDDLDFDDDLALLDGKPFTGIVTAAHAGGARELEYSYVDGLPDGQQQRWHANGQLASRWTAIRGCGTRETWDWHANGQLARHRRNDERGLAIELNAWDEAGQPTEYRD